MKSLVCGKILSKSEDPACGDEVPHLWQKELAPAEMMSIPANFNLLRLSVALSLKMFLLKSTEVKNKEG